MLRSSKLADTQLKISPLAKNFTVADDLSSGISHSQSIVKKEGNPTGKEVASSPEPPVQPEDMEMHQGYIQQAIRISDMFANHGQVLKATLQTVLPRTSQPAVKARKLNAPRLVSEAPSQSPQPSLVFFPSPKPQPSSKTVKSRKSPAGRFASAAPSQASDKISILLPSPEPQKTHDDPATKDVIPKKKIPTRETVQGMDKQMLQRSVDAEVNEVLCHHFYDALRPTAQVFKSYYSPNKPDGVGLKDKKPGPITVSRITKGGVDSVHVNRSSNVRKRLWRSA